MYIGVFEYKGVSFDFGFDGEELLLDPQPGFEDDARALIDTKTKNGWSGGRPAVPIDEDFLVLEPKNEKVQLVLFHKYRLLCNRQLLRVNYSVPVDSYFVLKRGESIERIEFESEQLNYIFDIQSVAKELTADIDFNSGHKSVAMQLEPISEYLGTFKLGEHEIVASMSISFQTTTKTGHFPVRASGSLCFSFDQTADYLFLKSLIPCAERFLRFCSFRYDARYESILLQNTSSVSIPDGQAGVVINRVGRSLPERTQQSDFSSIQHRVFVEVYGSDICRDQFCADVLQAAAEETVYTEHLPKMAADVGQYDVPRMLLIAAGFDWEFSQNFSEGYALSEDDQKVLDSLQEIFDQVKSGLKGVSVNSNVRNELDWLLDQEEKKNSFASKLKHARDKWPIYIDELGAWHYKHYGLPFDFNEIAKRIQEFRNAFAHGNMNYKFRDTDLADARFLEQVLLGMQLFRFNYGDEETVLEEVQRLYG